jgi:hypothetical protein
VPPPHHLYGAPPAVTAVNRATPAPTPAPVGSGPALQTSEVLEPFPVPARPQARQAAAEQSDTDLTPAKPSRRAARTPRARKSVEPVSDGAVPQGGDGSAA